MSDYGYPQAYPPLPYDWRDLAAAIMREYRRRERERAALLAARAPGPRYRVRALSLEELCR